jgi:hypothetical protein
MTFITCYLTPWINMTKALGAAPRILADDILMLATGQMHEHILVEALDATHIFMQDIGARVAVNKSLLPGDAWPITSGTT